MKGQAAMTFEKMQQIAALVRDALNASPDFTDAEVLTDALEAGQPLPVTFIDNDGNELVVALDVL